MDNELYLQLVIMNSYLNAIVTKLCGVEVNNVCLETANNLAKNRYDLTLDSLNKKERAREEERERVERVIRRMNERDNNRT